MALTTNKKNKIIADHKAKRFSSNTALAKYYKVDPKTVKKITEGIHQENADIVEAGVMYETLKNSSKNPTEIKAIEKIVEERTKEDRMRDIVLDNSLKISVHTTTASMKKLQENSTSKNKMETSDLIDHQRLAKLAKDTVTVKEEKAPIIENHLNMQQLQMSQEETNVEITVNDLEDEALLKLFKDRNLPK